MIITHKTECFPSEYQKDEIVKYFGVRRFVFNKTVQYLKEKYIDLKANAKIIHKKEVMDYRKTLRLQYSDILKTAPSQIVETVAEDFQLALISLKRKGKDIEYRKKKAENTCRISRKNATNFHYKNGLYLKIVKLGWLKLAESLRFKFNDNIKAVTIKEQAGRFFISITMDVDDNQIDIHTKTNRSVAFDYGIKTFLTGYNGKTFSTFDYDKNTVKKLATRIDTINRKLAKKQKGSNNYLRTINKLQQAYMDKENYLEDRLKKLANSLSKKYDYVILEDLKSTFMIHNRSLVRKALVNTFYKLKIILFNKLKHSDKKLLLANRIFPSTQLCSSCGNILKKKDKLKLSDHTYSCKCGFKMNRDKNAAINLFHCKELTVFEGYNKKL